MPNSLKIFLVISILVFFFHVLNNVRNNKLSVRNSIVWLILSIVIIICIFQIDNLEVIANFLGIKTVSNLLFFLGFIFLIFVTFDITRIISVQNKKIITLTQELSLLRNEIKKNEK